MNLQFDHNKGGRDQWIAWLAAIMAECRRVVKPGGYALVWALPRTSHWTAMALEDSGWTIRDSCHHIFATGFPKSKSCLKPSHEVWWLAKAPGPLQPLQIDATRVATGDSTMRRNRAEMGYGGGNLAADYTTGSDRGRWPSNLVLSHVGGPDGCRPAGVRRVEGTRPARAGGKRGSPHVFAQDAYTQTYERSARQGCADADGYETLDAWTCVPQCPIRLLDEQAGLRTSGATGTHSRRTAHQAGASGFAMRQQGAHYGDTGNASRFFPTFSGADPDPEDAVPFFYAAKASRAERNAGCAGLPAIYRGSTIRGNDDTPYWVRSHNPDPTVIAEYLKVWRERACLSKAEMDERLGTVTLYSWYEGRPQGTLLPTPEMWRKLKHILRFDDTHDHAMTDVRLREKAAPTFDDTEPGRNAHPTVKPLALGRWLTRLVAAPGSVVLDPFCGSGTLSAAAVLEGCHYIAIDCDESYCAIARARIAWAQQHRDGPLFAGAACDA